MESLGGLSLQEGDDKETEDFRERVYSEGDKDGRRGKSLLQKLNKEGNSSSKTFWELRIKENNNTFQGKSFLQRFVWPLGSKKRQRSGSAGSRDFRARKRTNCNRGDESGENKPCVSESLEILQASSSSGIYSYNWKVENFTDKVKNCVLFSS